ncbi:hypothetical protein M5689_002940 [Euphorbia peplus]|nr:hypothetical protein M5689_002940 [Euphorbia peplus]
MLFGGAEEELVNFLKDDNEIIKVGALHILAKAGGTIREQLVVASSSIDLILAKLLLKDSRIQAKYVVHALAAMTKNDGLNSFCLIQEACGHAGGKESFTYCTRIPRMHK